MRGVLSSLLLACCLSQEVPIPKEADRSPDASNPIGQIQGSLSLKYRYRWTGDQSDTDLYEFLTARWGDAAKDPLTLSASARFAEDLDGGRKVAGFAPFNSLDDTYTQRSTAQLYTAYVDLNRPVRLRGGRQVIEELPEAIPMDGGSVRLGGEGLSIAGFGGIPVNLFESSARGDVMYGGWIEVVPWVRGRARVEYLHLEDENVFGLFDDDLLGVTVEQGLGSLRFHGRYTMLEGESRDVTGRLTGVFAEAGLILEGQATYLFARQEALSYAIDPYALFLLELEPYIQWTVRASQAVGRMFGVDLSISQRKLVRGAEDGAYNHEFVHATVAPRLEGWPIPELSIALSGDYWRSGGSDYWTAGGDVGLKLHPLITIAGGTAYALYTLDSLTGEERERVRSVYASVRWKFPPASLLEVRLSLEDTALETYHGFEVGVRHVF